MDPAYRLDQGGLAGSLSPSNARTSPGMTRRSTPSSARTPPNRLHGSGHLQRISIVYRLCRIRYHDSVLATSVFLEPGADHVELDGEQYDQSGAR